MELSNGSLAPLPSAPNAKADLARIDFILIMLAFALGLVMVYNLLFAKCCAKQRSDSLEMRSARRSFCDCYSIPSSVYRKEMAEGRGCSGECAVCLCGFLEGEEIRLLPHCSHFFHVLCIDKWLDSRFDCPVCRVAVGVSPPVVQRLMEEDSQRQDAAV